MAPVTKKAKAKAAPSGPGLNKFFGKSGSEEKLGSEAPAVNASPPADASDAPVASPAVAPTPSNAKTLTEEQMKRIEESKRKALEKRMLKRGADGEPKPPPQPPVLPGVANVREAASAPANAQVATPSLNASDPAKAQAATPAQNASDASKASSKVKDMAAKSPFARAKAAAAKKSETPAVTPDGESGSAAASSPPRPPTPAKTPSSKGSQDDTPEKPLLPPERRSPTSLANDMRAGVRVPSERRDCPGKQTDRFKPLDDKAGAWMQYNDLYNLRLASLREGTLKQAKSLWANNVSNDAFLPSMSGLTERMGQQIVIVGILFRDMPARPNVIEKYSNHKALMNAECDGDVDLTFCSEADTFWLEDQAAMRIRLELQAPASDTLVTGLVCSMKGQFTEQGSFRVTAWTFSTPAPCAMPPSAKGAHGLGPFVAFVSGLSFGSGACDGKSRRILADFLTGSCQDSERKGLGEAVQRLVVCGGTVAREASRDKTVEAIAEADAFFAQVASVLPIDVMPGRGDPSNLSLPQDPLSPHFFRESRRFQDFRSVRNPYEASLGGMQVLGHSGQPVQDILRCSKMPSALQALMTCLEARHLMPTAPDTLPSQPYRDSDPFVIDTAPHVLFSGCHDREAHSWVPSASGAGCGTQCLCVPSFAKQPTVVLVSLRDAKNVRVVDLAGAVGGA